MVGPERPVAAVRGALQAAQSHWRLPAEVSQVDSGMGRWICRRHRRFIRYKIKRQQKDNVLFENNLMKNGQYFKIYCNKYEISLRDSF